MAQRWFASYVGLERSVEPWKKRKNISKDFTLKTTKWHLQHKKDCHHLIGQGRFLFVHRWRCSPPWSANDHWKLLKVIILIILYLVGELLAMQAGKLTNSRQLRKLSGRKSIGGRQSMSGGVRSSAMARGSFVAHIRKSRSEESEKNQGNGQFWLKI